MKLDISDIQSVCFGNHWRSIISIEVEPLEVTDHLGTRLTTTDLWVHIVDSEGASFYLPISQLQAAQT